MIPYLREYQRITKCHGNTEPYVNRSLSRTAEISRLDTPMAVQFGLFRSCSVCKPKSLKNADIGLLMTLVGSDYENDVADAFKDIEKDHLAKNTSLHALLTAADYSSKYP